MKLFFQEMDEITERDDESVDLLRRRLLGGAVVVLSSFSLILTRLWSLQIGNGDEYRQLAYNNRIRVQEIPPPRGHILDRFSREIVINRPSFNVVMIREDSHDIDDVLKRLALVLQEDISTLWQRIRDAAGTPRYMPIILKEDIDWQTLAYLENHNQKFSGIRILVQPVRVYKYKDLAANSIGYLGSISEAELRKADRTIYNGGDLVGKRGLEKLREADLRGEKGRRYTEVDAKGFERKQLKRIDPLPGREIHLTIDAELEKVAEDLMKQDDKAGAVVTMEIKTGRLLTLASTPSIHLEEFVGGISQKNWDALRDNPKNPLLNKVVQAAYPPGSTYKMISALTGLALGVIDADKVLYCPGYYRFGNRTYRCWKHGGHGAVNLERAISESCDVYFYQVGQMVGVDALAQTARKLGLGAKTDVELENEKSGVVPTKAWKEKRFRRIWQEGETLSVAIGQGYNLATPLQICLYTATLANGIRRMKPLVIEKVIDPDGKVVQTLTPDVHSELGIDPHHLDLVRNGMRVAVEGRHGTARIVGIKGLTIGAKTGTAQVVKLAQYRGMRIEDIPYKYRDHAWLTCFAPFEDPEIAVTVLVEHGIHGASGAGPIAKAVLEHYFRDRLQQTDEKKPT